MPLSSNIKRSPSKNRINEAHAKGVCPVCAYSRKDLKPGADCPECGVSQLSIGNANNIPPPPGERVEDLSLADRRKLAIACVLFAASHAGFLVVVFVWLFAAVLSEWLFDTNMSQQSGVGLQVFMITMAFAAAISGWMIGSERRSTSSVVLSRSWFSRLWAWVIPLGMWAMWFSPLRMLRVTYLAEGPWEYVYGVVSDICIIVWMLVLYRRLRAIKRAAWFWGGAIDKLAPAMPASWVSIVVVVFGCQALSVVSSFMRGSIELDTPGSFASIVYLAAAAHHSGVALELARHLWGPIRRKQATAEAASSQHPSPRRT